MKAQKSIWIVILVGLVSSFLCLSSQSFAVSPDVEAAIKTHYRGNGEIETAKKTFEEVVAADNNRNNEDRKYALIFLTILSLRDKNTEPADNYLCQIMKIEPDFDPDLSVRDITEDFRKRFSYLQRQNNCPNIESSCRGVKLVALKKQLEKCEVLFNQGIIKKYRRNNCL